MRLSARAALIFECQKQITQTGIACSDQMSRDT